MLQSMHDLAKSWVFKGLMLLLLVSFSIWGIGDMFRSRPGDRNVATVAGVKISAADLEMRFARDLPTIRQMLGANITAQQARQMGFLDYTLNRMIEEMIFDMQAKKLGLDISNAFILAELSQQPQLRDAKGNFNRQLWQEALRKMNLTESMFFELERRNIARQIILGSLMAGNAAPQMMIDHLYQARGAMRILEVVTLQDNKLAHEGEKDPDDETLRAFYDAHKDAWTAPATRAITIARLSAEDHAKNISVTDEELQQAYDAHRDSFKVPPSRDLVQVVLQDEKAAQALADNAIKQNSLANAARDAGLTPIVMTKVAKENIPAELFAPVFALAPGETSKPIKSSLGWHVVKISSVYGGNVAPFDEVKEDVKKLVQSEKSSQSLSDALGAIDDALAAGQSLEDVAESFRLHLVRFAAVDDKGQDETGKPIKDIPAPNLTLAAAQDLGAQEVSEILDDGQGHYYIVRVDQMTPSALRPFESVRADVEKAWRAQRTLERAEKLAQDIAKSVREGKLATHYAALPGVDVRLSKPISLLGAMDDAIPQTAVADIFQMKKGDVITAVGDGRHYVLRLSDIVPVDPKTPESSRQIVVDAMKDKMGIGIVDQYAAHLRALFPVQINMNALNAMKKQDENNEE